jgi:hypothetical protein
MRITTIIAFAIAGIVSTVRAEPPVQSAPEPSPTPAPEMVFWPNTARPQLQYTVVTVPFDNCMLDYGEIRGDGINWLTTLPSSWTRINEKSNRYSLLFKNRAGVTLTLGIAVFGNEEFMVDLKSKSWEKYLCGLKAMHGPLFSVKSESSAIEVATGGQIILGSPAREILFSRPGDMDRTVIEEQIFVINGGKLYAFCLFGPESEVNHNLDDFRRLIYQIQDRM